MKLKDLAHSRGFYWNNKNGNSHKEIVLERKTFGMPNGVECMYYDHHKDIILLGTSKGDIYLGGAPCVQITSKHSITCSVQRILAVDEATNKYITLCQSEKGSSIHAWELTHDGGCSELEEISYVEINLKIGKITECCLSPERKVLHIGTYSGHICQLILATMTLDHDVVYHENVRKKIQSNCSLGSVKCLSTQGLHDNMILVGYSVGTIILLDLVSTLPLCTFKQSTGLESLFMEYISGSFIASYTDGTICYWDLSTARLMEVKTRNSVKNKGSTSFQPSQKFRPFGENRCHPLKCVLWFDPFFLFISGTPIIRREHDYTMTVMSGGKILFQIEFGSRVIHMIPIFDKSRNDFVDSDYITSTVAESEIAKYPKYICVLTEEELIILNCQLVFAEVVLKKHIENITCCKIEHFPCIHASSVSTVAVYMNLSDEIFEKMNKVQRMLNLSCFQQNEWPINGGDSMRSLNGKNGFIITGHEDGTINFWHTSDSTQFYNFFRLHTNFMFQEYSPIYGRRISEIDNQNFPIFKCGYFDSFQEDIRFCIQTLLFDPENANLIVGGNAGNIMVFSFDVGRMNEVKDIKFDFSASRSDIEWKGHSSLTFDKNMRQTHFFLSFLSHYISIFPPAPITSLDYSNEWGLITASTCHGYIIYDSICNLRVTTKCTCDSSCLKDNGSLLRRTTVFKSLRSSFRRFSSRFLSKKLKKEENCESVTNKNTFQRPLVYRNSLRIRKKLDEPSGRNPTFTYRDANYSEGQSVGLHVSSPDPNIVRKPFVRTLKFSALNTKDNKPVDPILIVGCNSGWMYILSFIVPSFQDRYKIPVTLLLEKHIKSKNMAAVIDSCQLRKENVFSYPEDPKTIKQLEKHKHLSPSNVYIVTEEQIKIYEFPSLKSRGKIKVTAMTGSKIRKVRIFENILNKSPYENERGVSGLAILTSTGQLLIFSLATFRLCFQIDLIDPENIMAISQSYLNQHGCGYFMQSNSQITYFTLNESPIFLNSCVISQISNRDMRRKIKDTSDISNSTKNDSKNMSEVINETLRTIH